MAMTSRIIRLLYAFIALDILILDRWTKWLVNQKIALYGSIQVIPDCFKLVHLENPGAAFSILATASPAWRSFVLVLLSSAAMVVVGILLWRVSNRFTWVGIGLALVLGGAIGNLWDRILHGHVTDFLLVYYRTYEFPAFNAADSAISVGATILVLEILFGKQEKTSARSAPVTRSL